MNDPIFLTIDEVGAIHLNQIDHWVGLVGAAVTNG